MNTKHITSPSVLFVIANYYLIVSKILCIKYKTWGRLSAQESHTEKKCCNSHIGVWIQCVCVCSLLFSCPQIVWFITHSSHHYEPFYYFFQWNRFNLYGHEQPAWLQLLFLIKGIDSGIIWSCLVNNWLRMAEPHSVGLHEIQYPRQFGSALSPRPCSSIQNAICLQSGLTPLFTARQCQHTAHGNPRQWQAGGLSQDTINRLDWSFPLMESL